MVSGHVFPLCNLEKPLDFDGLAVMQEIMTEGVHFCGFHVLFGFLVTVRQGQRQIKKTKTKKLASKLGTHKGLIQNNNFKQILSS